MDPSSELRILIETWLDTRSPDDFCALLRHLSPLLEKIFNVRPAHIESCDLMQDFAAKLWKMGAQLRPEYREGWFVTVAVNLKRDRFRRWLSEQKPLQSYSSYGIELLAFDRTHRHIQHLCQLQAHVVLEQFLLDLDDRDRRLLQVYLFDNNGDVSRADAARALGRSETSLKKRYAKLLKQLRELMKSKLSDEGEEVA